MAFDAILNHRIVVLLDKYTHLVYRLCVCFIRITAHVATQGVYTIDPQVFDSNAFETC